MTDREKFEPGDEPLPVDRGRRAGMVLSVRLTAKEASQAMAMAEAEAVTLSQLVRRALDAYAKAGGSQNPVGIGGQGVTPNGAPLTVNWYNRQTVGYATRSTAFDADCSESPGATTPER